MRWASAPELFDPPERDLLDTLMLVRTAKWMGVAPWELAGQPIAWMDIASMAMEIEAASLANGSRN